MDSADICQIVDAVADATYADKLALLHDLAHRAAHTLNADGEVIFKALLKREELGSTGVGNGVAIPHVRLEQVATPFGILARLKRPIDFNAVDGQPVDIVCLLLLSKVNEGAQLRALAGVARRLRDPVVLQALRDAPNRVVLYNVMTGKSGWYKSE